MVYFGGDLSLKWDIKRISKWSGQKTQEHKCVWSLEYVKSEKIKDYLQVASRENGQIIF